MLFEASKGSVTSILQPTWILTHSQSEKLGVPPFEFPLPSFHKKTKKFESKTSTSKVL